MRKRFRLVYPIFSSLYYSLTTKHLIKATYDFIGFDNYIKVLTDPDFFKAFLTSILWTVASLLGQIIVGFTAALALNRVNHLKGVYRILMIIPWAFPSIVIALSWKWILNGVSGFLPNLLYDMGFASELPQFLSDSGLVFGTLIFINIWFGAPMIMVNVLSALQTIPQDQYEAAQIDGASKLQQFMYITVPHIKVVVGLLVVLRTIWVFNNFDIIYLITGGGPANATTTVPIGIEEAARVDGANKMVTFVRIVLPLVAPGIVATAIYTFINAWNEFLYSLILINSTDLMTVSVALRSLQGAEILDWGSMMAASTLVVIPSVVFFMFIQKYIAGGMTEGSVK